MNYNKSEQLIDITIIIGNSRDWKQIAPGRSYYLNEKRNTSIENILDIFYNNFQDEILTEIKLYSLFTKKMIKLYDNNIVCDAFSDIDDSDLDIYDKDETIFYLFLI